MNTRRTHPDRGFTLVELVVVVMLIAILAGLVVTASSAVFDRARRAQAKNDVTEIVTAVNAFYTEYGKYPIDPALGSGDVFYGSGAAPAGVTITSTNDKLVDVLRNNTLGSNAALVSTLNARGIVFLTISTSAGAWNDPWTSPYNALLDGNYNNQLPNPYSDAPSGATITTGVIGWSFGKDRKLGKASQGNPTGNGLFTGSDDVISWQ